MIQLCNRVVLLFLLSTAICLACRQSVYVQSSYLHDSLRHELSQIKEEVNDSVIQKAVKEAQVLYKPGIVNKTLSKKLLVLDSLLVNGVQANKSTTLSYATTLVELFKELSPQQEHPDYATSIDNLGLLYFNLGQYDKALPLHEQALSIRKKVLGEQHPDYATSLNNLASLYCKMGQYDKALPMHEQALSIRKKVLGEQSPDYAQSLNNLAHVYDDMGQYDKALPLYEQALSIRKKDLGEQHAIYARSLNNLAFLYYNMGQYDKALPLYEQVLSIRKKVLGEQNAEYAQSLNNLALLYWSMGQNDKALPLFEQALSIRKKVLGEQSPDYAQSLNNLASLYCKMGQYDKALPMHEQALSIRKKVLRELHPDFAQSLNNLAHVYDDMGQYDKALPLYEQALDIRKKVLGEQHPIYARSLNNLAFLYYNMGQYDKALPLYEQALNIRKKVLGEQNPEYAQSLSNLGILYSSTGNFNQASDLLCEAANSTIKYLNQTYKTLSEQEKMKLLKTVTSRFDYLPSLFLSQRSEQPSLLKQVYTNELTLKGMILEDQKVIINSIRKTNDSTTLRLYEQWQFNKAFIGKQILLPIAKRVVYFDSLQEATDQLEQELSRRAIAFHNLQQSHLITAKDVSQKLLKGEAAVEFIRFHLFNKKLTDSIMYAALVLLHGDSTPHFTLLFEEKQLERLLQPSSSANTDIDQLVAIKKLYSKGANSTSATFNDSLYHLLWKPLEPYLKGIHTVYYAPAGLLHRVAFEALPTDATHRLIDTYQLHQVLSTRSVVLPSSPIQKPLSVALWGNINYNTHLVSSLEPSDDSTSNPLVASSFNIYTPDTLKIRGGKDWGVLPGAKRELDNLSYLFQQAAIPASIYSGTAASEEAFKALNGRSPQLLHLATHGFFLPVEENNPKNNDVLSATGRNTFTLQQNPMFRSGLVLTGGNRTWKGEEPPAGKEDGILTAYEIAQLDLSNTDIVVLSACETALGDVQGNEGVIGLQRAFKLAGVKQLVMSLWRVSDTQTMELMTMFYNNWMQGQPPWEALRTAQLKMKEKYPPFYWAAFILVE